MTDVDKKRVDKELEKIKFEVAQEMGIVDTKKQGKKQKKFKKS
jgi:hypothetical protein